MQAVIINIVFLGFLFYIKKIEFKLILLCEETQHWQKTLTIVIEVDI